MISIVWLARLKAVKLARVSRDQHRAGEIAKRQTAERSERLDAMIAEVRSSLSKRKPGPPHHSSTGALGKDGTPYPSVHVLAEA
jgi:hypothetical protein